MNFRTTDYSHLFSMSGFSRRLLENHFTLYEGYVNNTNKLLRTLSLLDKEHNSEQFAVLNEDRGHTLCFQSERGLRQMFSDEFRDCSVVLRPRFPNGRTPLANTVDVALQ